MFKVGQVVWCKKRYQYSVTNYHVKCRVVKTSATCAIRVRVMEGHYSGNEYPVDGSYFELVQKKAVVV